MKKYRPQPDTKPTYVNERRVTTSRGKEVSRFVMHCKFYDTAVDETTGEIMPAQFYYRGDVIKLQYARRNSLNLENELTALLYLLYQIQRKCWWVSIYDNNYPMTESRIFLLEYGIVTDNLATAVKLKLNYDVQVRKFIPQYKFFPHEKVKA